MMVRFYIIVFLVIIACSIPRTGLSQPYHTTNGKALKAYKEGLTSLKLIKDFLKHT
jgi:hypothetical protein